MSATNDTRTTDTSTTGRMAFARWVARILGIVVALLAVAGLFVEGEWFLGIANVDLTLDIARIVIAVALLWVGFGRVGRPALSGVLAVVGIMYVLMGVLALMDNTLFGILPTGFSAFDIVFHIASGALAIVAAFVPPSASPRTAPGTGRPATARG